MGINEKIKKAKSVDPLPDIDPTEKAIATLKGKFSALIINKRYELGMNQKDFATLLGVSQTMISQWENCEYNFTLEKIEEISSKLGLKIDLTLLNNKESTPSGNSIVYSSNIPVYSVIESLPKKASSYSRGTKGQTILQYT